MKVNYNVDEESKKIVLTPSDSGYDVYYDEVKGVDDFKPLHDYVLVLKDKEKEVSFGGIYIPETSQEAPSTGVVIKASDTSEIKEGSRLFFLRYGGQPITIGDVDYVLLKYSEILGILK